jgi:hypothetical protein
MYVYTLTPHSLDNLRHFHTGPSSVSIVINYFVAGNPVSICRFHRIAKRMGNCDLGFHLKGALHLLVQSVRCLGQCVVNQMGVR